VTHAQNYFVLEYIRSRVAVKQ